MGGEGAFVSPFPSELMNHLTAAGVQFLTSYNWTLPPLPCFEHPQCQLVSEGLQGAWAGYLWWQPLH
jgi:hypothetical protein